MGENKFLHAMREAYFRCLFAKIVQTSEKQSLL